MKLFATWSLLLSCAVPAIAADKWTVWVEPCTAEIAAESHCFATDPELARWALESWRRAAAGGLEIVPVLKEQAARMRVHWISGRSQLYGEARSMPFEGKRGADVYVLPTIAQRGEDALLRETVVYLTCLHETGHALGLAHTNAFADIMYSFQYGGDIDEYFGRFRRQLKTRADIANGSAISAADKAALLSALSRP